MTDLITNREKFRKITILLMLVAITAAFLWMIRTYLEAVLLATVFTGLSHPLYRRLLVRFRGRQALASVATLMILLLVVIIPLLGFLGVVVAQAYELSQEVIPWFQESLEDPSAKVGQLPEWIPLVDELSPLVDRLRPYTSQIFAKLGELTGKIGAFLVSSVSAGTKGTAVFFLNLFIMLYAMFFFLMHGPALRQRLLSYSPLSDEDKDRLLEKGLSVTRATIKGTLVIGMVQGALGGLAFAVVGIRGAAFWATIMAVLSVIPGVGTALVWVPAVVYLLIKGQIGAGVGLLIWSAAVVGSVDNLLRPRLVGGDTQMPDLLILLSTLGGLSLFGAIGLILGPLVAALFLTVWDIYRVSFRDLLPEGGEVSE